MPRVVTKRTGPILKRDFISSLAKGLDVLRAFNSESPQLSTAELAEKLGISRASARRFLLTLTELGYLRIHGNAFQATSKVLSLSAAFLSDSAVSTLSQPHILEVARRTEESCSVGILENNMVIVIARAPARWILTAGVRVGASMPAYCTAIGRVLLAALSDDELTNYLASANLVPLSEKTVTNKSKLRKLIANVRKKGYSIVDQELELGLRAIAVPIVQDGKIVASITSAMHVTRYTMRRLKDEFLPILQESAQAIGRELSHT